MTNKYKVQFSKHYLKDLEKIPKKDREQIRQTISSLSVNPRHDGCKKLKGTSEPLYRIRCGDYRVIYTIQDKVLVVLVIEVGHRKEIYKSF